jgi:hypothetical protein
VPIRMFPVAGRLKCRSEQATATRPCVHRVDAFGSAEDSGLIRGDADASPYRTIVGASQDAGAQVKWNAGMKTVPPLSG